ncbi:MAG: hypothetical protein JSV86_04695 [Gemmatimonadota bacterium]|nr:MAG: hypothetical protein JSV86_04695 [Gemmatimonadota bacterium]
MKIRKAVWLTRVAVVAVLLSFFAACDDDTTAPLIQLDPESAAATLDNILGRFVDENEAGFVLDYLAYSMYEALSGGPIEATADFDLRPADTPGAEFPRLLLGQLTYTAAAAGIPDEFNGTTFVWDVDLEQYVESELTGAPTNGVRFILYAIDVITELPDVPLDEIGYLDIIDAATWPDVDLTLRAVIGTATLIYMEVTGFFGELSEYFDFDGYFSDGSDAVDFTFYVEWTPESEIVEFSLDYYNFEVFYDMTWTELGAAVEATLTDGTNDLVFNFGLEYDMGYVITEGSNVTFNGVPIALISGTFDYDTPDVTMTNAADPPLGTAELAALEFVFEAMWWTHYTLFDMLEFVGALAYLDAPR